MNTYGFNKVDADGWTFAHPHFRRDDPEAAKLIKRRAGGLSALDECYNLSYPLQGAR